MRPRSVEAGYAPTYDAVELADALDLLVMKGKIYARSKCPQHTVPFAGLPLRCPTVGCSERPEGPFRIEIYDSGHLHKISSGPKGETLDTQKVALKFLVRINQEIAAKRFDPGLYNKNRGRGAGQWTFRTYAEKHMADKTSDAEAEQNAPATVRLHQMYLTRHLYPRIGDMDIRDINAVTLKDLRRELLEKPAHQRGGKALSAKYTWNILAFLHSVLAEAKRDDMIDKVPDIPDVKRKKRPRKQVLRPEQQLLVLRDLEAAEPEHAPIFWAMYFTGHRPAECAALRMKDYWRAKRMLDFARTYSDDQLQDGRKADDEHLVPIPDQLCEILDRMLDARMASSLPPLPDALLFVPPQLKTGRPPADHYRNHNMPRIWARACGRVRVPYIGLYESTKHSLGARMLELGMTRAQIAAVLGITEQMTHHYAEYEAEMLRPIVDRIHGASTHTLPTESAGSAGKADE